MRGVIPRTLQVSSLSIKTIPAFILVVFVWRISAEKRIWIQMQCVIHGDLQWKCLWPPQQKASWITIGRLAKSILTIFENYIQIISPLKINVYEEDGGALRMQNLSQHKCQSEREGLDLMMLGNFVRQVWLNIFLALYWLILGQLNSSQWLFISVSLHLYDLYWRFNHWKCIQVNWVYQL